VLPRASILLLLLLVSFVPVRADTIVLNFDNFIDSTLLSAQYYGVSFSGAIILNSGITLNEFEFPAHSGSGVVSDNNGPITIIFSSPVQSFSGYFTYGASVTMEAFGTGGTQVASATSHYSNNEALSGAAGSSPNELIQVSYNSGISKVTITGNPAGTSFVMDDAAIVTPFSPCDVNQNGSTNVLDVQQMINQALGGMAATNDLDGDQVVNVVDVQLVINAVLKLGCSVV
jgi:hypothetical protein